VLLLLRTRSIFWDKEANHARVAEVQNDGRQRVIMSGPVEPSEEGRKLSFAGALMTSGSFTMMASTGMFR